MRDEKDVHVHVVTIIVLYQLILRSCTVHVQHVECVLV